MSVGQNLKIPGPQSSLFLSNKGCNTSKDTILTENENLITDQKQACGIFNNYFVNVANDIGDPNVVVNTNHPSILQIDQIMADKEIPTLHFKPVDDNFVKKQINSISVKKATGVNNISLLLLKQASSIIAQPLTKLINKSMQQSIFPDDLKTAKVCPIHKKNSLLDSFANSFKAF